MPRKPKPPPDDPKQFKRFTDLAREVGADTDPETLGRVFDKITQPKGDTPKPSRRVLKKVVRPKPERTAPKKVR